MERKDALVTIIQKVQIPSTEKFKKIMYFKKFKKVGRQTKDPDSWYQQWGKLWIYY